MSSINDLLYKAMMLTPDDFRHIGPLPTRSRLTAAEARAKVAEKRLNDTFENHLDLIYSSISAAVENGESKTTYILPPTSLTGPTSVVDEKLVSRLITNLQSNGFTVSKKVDSRACQYDNCPSETPGHEHSLLIISW